jgi:hypothetical protein
VSPTEWGGPKIPAVDRLPGLRVPAWLQALGRGAWLLVGIAVLLAIAFFLLGLVSDLVIPLVFAAILAAIFVPLVDRLERWAVPRWLGAPLGSSLSSGWSWSSPGWWWRGWGPGP